MKVREDLASPFSSMKRCPFCNGEGELYIEAHTFPEPPVHYVYCSKCLARGSYAFGPEEALTLWNTRHMSK